MEKEKNVVSNVQYMAALGLASMALADLADFASDSGDKALNEMFNQGGVGYEASQAIKRLLSAPQDPESGVQIALHLLRVANHPLAYVHDAAVAGELYSCIHSHRHGVDSFVVRADNQQEIVSVLKEMDPIRFEFDREDEYLDTSLMKMSDLYCMDLRDPSEESEEACESS